MTPFPGVSPVDNGGHTCDSRTRGRTGTVDRRRVDRYRRALLSVSAAGTARSRYPSALCVHYLRTTAAAGFLAMQFNAVVATNTTALRLWRKHGFTVVGRVPKAFRHPRPGLTDLLARHRFLP